MYRNLPLIFTVLLPCVLFSGQRESDIAHAQGIIVPPRLMKNDMMQSHKAQLCTEKNGATSVAYYSVPVHISLDYRVKTEPQRAGIELKKYTHALDFIFENSENERCEDLEKAPADSIAQPKSPEILGHKIFLSKPLVAHMPLSKKPKPVYSARPNPVSAYPMASMIWLTQPFSRTLVRVWAKIV
jgi:hypothetical protein